MAAVIAPGEVADRGHVPVKSFQGLKGKRVSRDCQGPVLQTEFQVRDLLSRGGLATFLVKPVAENSGVVCLFLTEATDIKHQRMSLPFSIKEFVSERCP